MQKVFVIALDGVGFPLIDPWIKDGKLPHLAELLARGVHGPLRSTIPPLTGPAWSTFQTGVNPGKHGVSCWTKRRNGSYDISVVSGNDILYPTIWELASEHGRQVVSIGLPLSYPPRKVNGVIIPGMLTPESDPAPTTPPEAFAELNRVVPDYHFSPECAQRFTIKGKTKTLVASVRGRAEAAKHFLRKTDWDLAMLHFQATDKVQHDLWGIKRNGLDPLLSVFQEVDRQIGELLEIVKTRKASVILLSDHGMGPLEYTFSINTWLLRSGYLQLKQRFSTRFKHIAFRLGFTQKHLAGLGLLLYPLAYRLGLVGSLFDTVGKGWLARAISILFLSLDDIDWSRTRAYSYADIGHIRLNRRGREPEGLVSDTEAEALISELLEQLHAIVNPYTDEPLLGQAYRREEVYHGERLGQAPDVVFLPLDLRTVGSGASGFYSNRLFDRPLLRAHHRMQGIISASGEPFRPHFEMHDARLVDLATNILYLLDCPIPTYMDGTLWKEAFTPEMLASQPPRYSEQEPPEDVEEKVRDLEQEEELQRRLKGLGYLN